MFRTAYGDRNRVQTKVVGESLTQQQFKEETDIKNIIKKYDRTGILSHVQKGVAQYGDYSEVNEYREYLDFVNNANANFMALPSEVRLKFNNDAGEFFEFATDPKNHQNMVEMGLAEDQIQKVENPQTNEPAATEKPAE